MMSKQALSSCSTHAHEAQLFTAQTAVNLTPRHTDHRDSSTAISNDAVRRHDRDSRHGYNPRLTYRLSALSHLTHRERNVSVELYIYTRHIQNTTSRHCYTRQNKRHSDDVDDDDK
jgi:hypothetical protein